MRASVALLGGAIGLLFAGCGGGNADTGLFDATSTTSAATGAGGMGGSGGNTGSAGGMMSGTGGAMSGAGGAMAGTGGAGGGPIPLCGDGNVDYMAGEECDDGNLMAGDGCSAACSIEAAATCGDGVLDLVNDEECDDGDTKAGDGCSPACQLEQVGQACGNGMTQAPEVCDDANTINGDGCNPTCNLAGTTSLFAGSPNQPGNLDGVGQAARFGGSGVLTVNATHLFVGDEPNRTLRQVDVTTAAVQTIAGDALGGMQGYVDNAIGLNARFGSIEALATDGTTIWAADGVNRRIRAVAAAAPNAVTTIAGSGNQGYQDGIGAAVQFDGIRGLTYYNGVVYFLDPTAATLRRLDPATNEVITLAGTPYMTGQVDGLGPAARFISPRYMASDGSGMLYIADTNGNQLRAYNTVTTQVSTFAGSGACGYADGTGILSQIHRPRGMTSDGTSLYWVEYNAHTVRQAVVATGEVSTLAGTPPGCTINCNCGQTPQGGYTEGTGAVSVWSFPYSVAFHYPSASLFVMDGGNEVIRRIQ
jgi:cysteine-rich repeat protein